MAPALGFQAPLPPQKRFQQPLRRGQRWPEFWLCPAAGGSCGRTSGATKHPELSVWSTPKEVDLGDREKASSAQQPPGGPSRSKAPKLNKGRVSTSLC